ncbi:MAG TPA: hypothetical protein P5136_02700 [Methanofastidiosum sp.]|nr:hypothetical protein [Methanofastidiosum sp.]
MPRHCQLVGNNLHISRVTTGIVSPVGVQTPTIIGELYADTVHDIMWVATGLTSADWNAVSGGGGGSTGDLTASTGLAVTGGTSAVFGAGARIGISSGYHLPTDAEKSAWDGAVTNEHTHTNKSNLDTINQNMASTDIVDFAGIDVNNNLANPSHLEGRLFYDRTKHAISYYNEEPDVTVNLGQEFLIRVKNETGSTIPNGTAVYPAGTSTIDGEVLVGLADASEKEKCRFVGLVTHEIAHNETGYVTRLGEVGFLDTLSISSTGGIVYLSDTPGQLTATQPQGGSYAIRVGAIKKVSATEGIIIVDVYVPEVSVEQTINTGFSRYDLASIAFSDTSPDRTLTISPIAPATYFSFYQYGDKYEKTTDSIQIPNEEGLFLIYYNYGVLTYLKNPTISQTDNIIKVNPTVAYVYWDAESGIHRFLGNELHTIGMNPITHSYIHKILKFRYLTGLAPNTYDTSGDGSLDSHAQFGIDSGSVCDEDLTFATSTIGATTGLKIVYLDGTYSAPVLRTITNAGFSVLTTGSGRLAYNTLSGLDFVISEVANGDFVNCHIIANNSNTISERVLALIGQNTYTTAVLAAAGAATEISNAQGLAIIPPEVKAIATFVFETRNTFGNSVKARIVDVDTEGTPYIDWRTVQVAFAGGGGGGGGGTVFDDDAFELYDNVDPTKTLKFQLSPISTGTARTLSTPNANGTIATQEYVDAYFPVQEDNLFLNDVATWNVTSTGHGFIPKLSGNSSQYFDGTGNWTIPAGGGGGVPANYSLTSFSSQTSVNVVHNFGTYPLVQVLSSTGTIVAPASIVNNTVNDFTVTFSDPTTGSIIATMGSPALQAVKTISTDYTALTSDRILDVNTLGKIITLYTAIGNTGRELIIDNTSPADIYVTGTETIQGETTQDIPPGSAIHLYSNGAVWRIY